MFKSKVQPSLRRDGEHERGKDLRRYKLYDRGQSPHVYIGLSMVAVICFMQLLDGLLRTFFAACIQ